MIFNIHPENIFGFKRLTDADLGRGTSHQTHIGLYEGVLHHLNNVNEIRESYLVFEDKCFRLNCYFDRIEVPDGTYRSPKIRYGESNSIVRKIRSIAYGNNDDFFLLWFSLDNNELVFILMKEGSDDHQFFTSSGCISRTNTFSRESLRYITERFNSTNKAILAELEISAQGMPRSTKFRRIDLERAIKKFHDTGLKGEEAANRYLEYLNRESLISGFQWMNKSSESGLPFDFIIRQLDSKERFIDVKTTRYMFSTPMIFSTQEMKFVAENDILYSVFRVYGLDESNPVMRICDNCRDKMCSINDDFVLYQKICQGKLYDVQSIFAVRPDDPILKFNSEIRLDQHA